MKFVAVEFDLYDEDTASVKVFRICANGPVFTYDNDGIKVQFEERLELPIQIGTKINAEQYGSAIRGAPNSGTIEFAINDERIWPWLNYHWVGRKFRIYKGETEIGFGDIDTLTVDGEPLTVDEGNPLTIGGRRLIVSSEDDLINLEPIYVGNILDLSFTTTTPKATVKITDSSLDFDKPLISLLYEGSGLTVGGEPLTTGGEQFTVREEGLTELTSKALFGLPKPRLWGNVRSIAPVLENEVDQIWRISSNALSDVVELRVGGVVWNKVTGTPGAGEWSADLTNGTVRLGSVTLGGEVRCDAKAVGWEALTTGKLVQEIIEENDGIIDTNSFDSFNSLVSGLIGFYTTTEAINIQDALDQIMLGAGGWWCVGNDGKVRIGVIQSPDSVSDFDIGEVDVGELDLSGVILPAWRIRVEYDRNWMVVSNFFSGVTDAEQRVQSATGVIAPIFTDENIKTLEPKAIDAPLIRSLFNLESDAILVRDRLSAAWGRVRKLYDSTVFQDGFNLYDTVGIDYLMVSGRFRIHSVVLNITSGEDFSNIQVWG